MARLPQDSSWGSPPPDLDWLCLQPPHLPASHLTCACRADMDARKSALVEALAAKCGALLELAQLQAAGAPAAGAPSPFWQLRAAVAAGAAEGSRAEGAEGAAAGTAAPDLSGYEAAFRELRKWVDTAADDKVGWSGLQHWLECGSCMPAAASLAPLCSPCAARHAARAPRGAGGPPGACVSGARQGAPAGRPPVVVPSRVQATACRPPCAHACGTSLSRAVWPLRLPCRLPILRTSPLPRKFSSSGRSCAVRCAACLHCFCCLSWDFGSASPCVHCVLSRRHARPSLPHRLTCAPAHLPAARVAALGAAAAPPPPDGLPARLPPVLRGGGLPVVNAKKTITASALV